MLLFHFSTTPISSESEGMSKLYIVGLLLVSWSCLAALAQAKSYGFDLSTDNDNAIANYEDNDDKFPSW